MNPNRTSSLILVWDLPTRLFHWLFAASFAGAWLTAESERWRDVHILLGYSMLVLLAFRVVWGIGGPRYARFASFAFAPREAIAYLRASLRMQAPRYVGHNPAGSIAIYALLVLAAIVAASGMAALSDQGDALEDVHEAAAALMLALALAHIAGTLVASVLHRENLVSAMLTGYKHGAPRDAIGAPRRVVAMVLLAALTGVWTGAVPLPGVSDATAALTAIKVHAAPARDTRDDD